MVRSRPHPVDQHFAIAVAAAMGLSIWPAMRQPSLSASLRTRAIAATRAVSSVTMPFLPTWARPTSNWGFTSATSSAAVR